MFPVNIAKFLRTPILKRDLKFLKLKTELKNRVTDCDITNRVKSSCDAIANFLLNFRNSEFLVKMKFPSYLTRKFYLYLIKMI